MWSFTGPKGVQGEMNKWPDVKKNSGDKKVFYPRK